MERRVERREGGREDGRTVGVESVDSLLDFCDGDGGGGGEEGVGFD